MSDPADVARKIFINDEGELRSGWRALAFVFLLVITLTLVSTLIGGLGALIPELGYYLLEPSQEEGPSPRVLVYLNINQVVSLASALIATAIAARVLERRSFASTGYKLHRGWLRDFALGSLLGAATLSIAVAIAAAAGAIILDNQVSDAGILLRNFAIIFFFFLIAGAFEEVMFRGFAFQALVHNIGPVAAVAITSLLFGLAHLRNPSASSFSTINTILAGVWLGVAYLATRSLWLATALHYSWNLAMVFIFGLPVSGFTTFDQLTWLDGKPARPEWLSGGSYGPEGGLAATIALLLSTLIIWKTRLFSPSEEVLAAIKHGKPEPHIISIGPQK